jgi:dimethylargininase
MRALVRRPSTRLADGIVTHAERRAVDVGLAREQWQAYVRALGRAGWEVVEAPVQDECPDGVFVEDCVVVYGDLAVLTRPGSVERRAELEGMPAVMAALGYRVAELDAPATLDGGDVLIVGETVYVGLSTRTNEAGARLLVELLRPLGAQVVEVTVRDVLHLKSAVTALPDGTIVGHPRSVPPSFRDVLSMPEESGAQVVLLGGKDVLVAADCPASVELLSARGYEPVVVDISEFQKLDGCVTCLSVLLQ